MLRPLTPSSAASPLFIVWAGTKCVQKTGVYFRTMTPSTLHSLSCPLPPPPTENTLKCESYKKKKGNKKAADTAAISSSLSTAGFSRWTELDEALGAEAPAAHEVGNTSPFSWNFVQELLGRQIAPLPLLPPAAPSRTLCASGWRRGSAMNGRGCESSLCPLPLGDVFTPCHTHNLPTPSAACAVCSQRCI